MTAAYEAKGVTVEAVPDRSYQMLINEQRFCVYAHVHKNTIFYIGQGRLGRPFDATMRNSHWHQFVQYVGTYTIEILGYFDTMSAAKAEEVRLLRLFQPACNLNGTKTALEPDAVPITSQPGPLRDLSPAVLLLQAQEQREELEKCYQELVRRYTGLEIEVANYEDEVLGLEARCRRAEACRCVCLWPRIRKWIYRIFRSE